MDAAGLNVFWISDMVEAEQRSWWRSADMSKVEKTEETDNPPPAPARKRAHSAWNVFRGEDG